MRVCFVSSRHTPLDKRVFDKEARSLAMAGFEVIHLAPGNIQTIVKEGILLMTFPLQEGLIGRAFGMIRLYRMARKINADVYHCNEVDSWIVGVILKLFKRKKVVFDVHEHYPTTFGYDRFPKLFQPICAVMIRILYKCLTPLTDYLFLAKKSIGSDFPNANNKMEVIYNYTPIRNKSINRMDVPIEIQRSFSDKFTAIHIGLFNINRGWPQLLSSMMKITIPNFQFISIGEINDGTEGEFWETASRFGLKHKIVVKPWLPFEEAYWHLLCSDVGLVLFQPEDLNNVYAFPHKMFDYMLASLPVIIPEFAVEIAPIVKRNNCGLLIDTTNPNNIANAINMLGKSNDIRLSMGRNGRQAVIEECNWESQAEKLVNYYRTLQ